MTRPANTPAYEGDFVAWLEDEAQRARRGETDSLDLENIAEKLEGMARSDRREIRNRLTVFLTHLLKFAFQSKRRSSSGLGTISQQRTRISIVIDDSPSLRSLPEAISEECYADARSRAALETRFSHGVFPERCPFAIADVLDTGWLPSERAK